MDEAVDRLAALLLACPGAVVLTGAGISTESGIPDFRSPGTGIYANDDPAEVLSVEALARRPERFWGFFASSFEGSYGAQPNAGHVALARLAQAGHVGTIVTQNIDDLHERAGSPEVLHVHGHLRTARCRRGHVHGLEQALGQLQARPVPVCPDCAGPIKPDVVLFGDQMSPDFERAIARLHDSDLVLVVGSSLAVYPANQLAFLARRLAIINRDPTPADGRASVVVRGSAGEALSALAMVLLGDDR